MRRLRVFLWICVLLSAALLSLPWLVPHCGGFALIGFVPLLIADYAASREGIRHFWIWDYTCFVLWNAATTWWVGNATVGGAVFAVLANALQMSLAWGLFRLFCKRIGGIIPYIFLAAAWIAWEAWYLRSAQISWPWLVLGNAFAQSTRSIQWYEYTGHLGGSLWVWTVNISIFRLIRSIAEGAWKDRKPFAKLAAIAWVAGAVVFPYAASAHLYHYYEENSEGRVPVVIAQPNFDPYHKFEKLSQAEQTEVLLSLYESVLQGDATREGLLLAPETFTSDVWLNRIEDGPTFRKFVEYLQGYPRMSMLFGAASVMEYHRHSPPSLYARKMPFSDTVWRESYNSAVITDASARAEVCHKGKLVVGTELTPYPKIFVPLDDRLGGLMGRDVPNTPQKCLHLGADGPAIGCAICYESVYGEYCTEYVRQGARALAVITNDAWWGDTPGYRQHLSYACLRAIETRRDIARCGNTGISAFIDQRGEVLDETPWWEEAVLCGELNLSSHRTFFVRHPRLVGDFCIAVFALLAVFGIVFPLFRRRG